MRPESGSKDATCLKPASYRQKLFRLNSQTKRSASSSPKTDQGECPARKTARFRFSTSIAPPSATASVKSNSSRSVSPRERLSLHQPIPNSYVLLAAETAKKEASTLAEVCSQKLPDLPATNQPSLLRSILTMPPSLKTIITTHGCSISASKTFQ